MTAPTFERWEYLSRFLRADAFANADYLAQKYPHWPAPPYAPQAMEEQLNEFGADGWELVSLTPVTVGEKDDVLTPNGYDSNHWTNAYFSVFKRRASSDT